MTDLKISDLTSYTSLEDDDVFVVVDTINVETKKISWADIKSNINSLGYIPYTGATPITATSGSETEPIYSFESYPGTGIWNPSANAIGFSVNGVNKMTLGDTGTLSIRPNETSVAAITLYDASYGLGVDGTDTVIWGSSSQGVSFKGGSVTGTLWARIRATGFTSSVPLIVNSASSATGDVTALTVTGNSWTNSTLVNKLISGSVTINQSGSAGFALLDFSVTQSSVGTGEKVYQRFNKNGSGIFTVDYNGRVAINKTIPAVILGMVDIVTDSTLADTIPSIVAGKTVTNGNSLGASFRNLTGTTGNAMIEIAGIASGAARASHLRTDSSGNFGIYAGSTAYGTLGTQAIYVAQSTRFVGIGTHTTISAALHVLNTTTNQFRVGYSTTQYFNMSVNSVAGVSYNAQGTSPLHEFKVNGSTVLLMDSARNSYFGGNTGFPSIYIQGESSGAFLSAGAIIETEAGIYSSNGDEKIATYDSLSNKFEYMHGYLYSYFASNITSTLPFYILNTDGSQLTVGVDVDNFLATDVAINGDVSFYANSNTTTPRFWFNERVTFAKTAKLTNYTVATLPTSPESGDIAYVTDALTPAWNATVVGGGTVGVLVQYNGTNWVVA